MDKLRDNPAPKVECYSCGNTSLHFSMKREGGNAEKHYYDCPECDHEGEARIVYARVVR